MVLGGIDAAAGATEGVTASRTNQGDIGPRIGEVVGRHPAQLTCTAHSEIIHENVDYEVDRNDLESTQQVGLKNHAVLAFLR